VIWADEIFCFTRFCFAVPPLHAARPQTYTILFHFVLFCFILFSCFVSFCVTLKDDSAVLHFDSFCLIVVIISFHSVSFRFILFHLDIQCDFKLRPVLFHFVSSCFNSFHSVIFCCFILTYSGLKLRLVLFHFVSLCFTLFHLDIQCGLKLRPVLFNFILSCFILFYPVLSCFILFHFVSPWHTTVRCQTSTCPSDCDEHLETVSATGVSFCFISLHFVSFCFTLTYSTVSHFDQFCFVLLYFVSERRRP
jgi:hypothetical protein